MIIEGKNSVKEALASEKTVERVYVTKGNFEPQINEIVRLAKERKVRVVFSEKQAMDSLSETGKHQNVIAVVTEFVYDTVEDILSYASERGEEPLLVILDGVQDPQNLGAIMRSAECLGAHGVVIGKHRSASVNETAIRTSAGAAEHIRVAKVSNVNDVIRKLKEQFINVICADMDGEPLNGFRFEGGIALVIGGEGEGVKRLTKELCDSVVSIPQKGKINSLNASVAAGILLYCATLGR